MPKFKFEKNSLSLVEFNKQFAELLEQINRNEVDEIDLSNLQIIMKEKNGEVQRPLNEEECEKLCNALKENTSVKKIALVNSGISLKSIKKFASLFGGFGANDMGNQTLLQINLKDSEEKEKKVKQEEGSMVPDLVVLAEKRKSLENNLIKLNIAIEKARSSKIKQPKNNANLLDMIQQADDVESELTAIEKRKKAMERELTVYMKYIRKGTARNRAPVEEENVRIKRERNQRERDEALRIQRNEAEKENRVRMAAREQIERERRAAQERVEENERKLKAKLEKSQQAYNLAKQKASEKKKPTAVEQKRHSLQQKAEETMRKMEKRIEREETERLEAERERMAKEQARIEQEKKLERERHEQERIHKYGKKHEWTKTERGQYDQLIQDLENYLENIDKKIEVVKKERKGSTITFFGTDLQRKRNLANNALNNLKYDAINKSLPESDRKQQPLEELFPLGPKQLVDYLIVLDKDDKALRMASKNPIHGIKKGKLGELFEKNAKLFAGDNKDLKLKIKKKGF